jgi:hypothetical protein
MIGQYLPNNNETATVAFRQKICQLNSPQFIWFNGPAPGSGSPCSTMYTACNVLWWYSTSNMHHCVSMTCTVPTRRRSTSGHHNMSVLLAASAACLRQAGYGCLDYPTSVFILKILYSILNSPAAIHPLYHPLSTLSTVGPTCHFI